MRHRGGRIRRAAAWANNKLSQRLCGFAGNKFNLHFKISFIKQIIFPAKPQRREDFGVLFKQKRLPSVNWRSRFCLLRGTRHKNAFLCRVPLNKPKPENFALLFCLTRYFFESAQKISKYFFRAYNKLPKRERRTKGNLFNSKGSARRKARIGGRFAVARR